MPSINLYVDQIWVRLLVVALVWVVILILYKVAKSNFRGHQRIIFKFICLCYLVTYFIGTNIIFVFGESVLQAYFHILVFPTSDMQNLMVLLLGIIPFLALAFISLWPVSGSQQRAPLPTQQSSTLVDRSTSRATFATAFLVLALVLVFLGAQTPGLLVNSILLGNISGSANLYAARSQAFDGINFVQGGLIYGTLPALTAGLLEYKGPNKILARMVTAIAAILVIFLNLGLYQVAPLFAFLFILGLTQILRSSGKAIKSRHVVLGALLFLGYSFYSTLKVSGGVATVGDSLFQIILRMPIAGPYLVDMKEHYGGAITFSEYVPRLLGYHMFPEFWARGAHISMPQPSFLITWYHFGMLASFGALSLGLILPFWLSSILISSRKNFSGFQGAVLTYSLCHYVYYLFQTSHTETIVSSYGIIFPLVPYFIFAVLNGSPHPSRIRHRSPPQTRHGKPII